jgi:hypothetical protein
MSVHSVFNMSVTVNSEIIDIDGLTPKVDLTERESTSL